MQYRKIRWICQLPNFEVGVSLDMIIRTSAVFGPSRRGWGGGVILCSCEVCTISKYNYHCIYYNLIC